MCFGTSLKASAPAKFIFNISCILLLVSVPMHIFGFESIERALLACSTPCAWSILLFFARYVRHSQYSNKAVVGHRLRPRCCQLRSYFMPPKSSSVRPLACNWHYCAQFIAKPKAACALRFSWTATSSNLGL